MVKNKPNILWFNQIGRHDIDKVGGKGANLGEMYNNKIPVPNGFVVTSGAYISAIQANNLEEKMKSILKATNIDNQDELVDASQKIKKIINRLDIPRDIVLDVAKAYKKLCSYGGLKNVPVAVRSSATAEDLPDASFAGQQETFLNVVGESNVINRVRSCWASLFTPRAIFYREKKGFSHLDVAVAVPVQKMVQAEISGVMFSINPVNNDKEKIVIEAVWGLGEYIVQGTVTPDQHLIDKNNWKIISTKVIPQKIQLVKSRNETKKKPVPKHKQNKQKLTDSQIISLAKIGQKLHNHYLKPQDIEWAIEKNRIYIVQTRPVTTVQVSEKSLKQEKKIEATPVLEGDAASPGTASGEVIIVNKTTHINKVKKGQILVTDMTTPDFVPAMRKVSGIITNKGGQTSHAAIVSRELGVPCIVGTVTATKKFKNGQILTMSGSTGQIWEGDLSSQIQEEKPDFPILDPKIKTATKIYLNLAEPLLAKDMSKRPISGVGLLRAEFIIANMGEHPRSMLKKGKGKKFIQDLSKSLIEFCKHFNPRPVVYRFTDFKTNEYRSLKGGAKYEPHEENPMIGFRGAGRYIANDDVFQLELEAIKKVRNQHRYKNLWVMIPFVRTPQELLEVKKIMSANGLARSPSFQVWMMVEIPSNVILLKKFVKTGIDGISIGSNDLTMLTLGIDRDNEKISKTFNEMDPAVLWSLKRAITTAKKLGITSSICGQAPSNYPELVKKLVRWGITSISVSPDAIERTRSMVYEAEGNKLKT